MVSPQNHFVFTPLLPSAAVGTLESRCIQEPVRSILSTNGTYLQAKARTVDVANKKVICESLDNEVFEVNYDKLVIAVGVKTNTFGIKSISEMAQKNDSVFFLKRLQHARTIRGHIIDMFEKASIPTVSGAERRRLLSFLVVGGGPTSCEFTAELHGTIVGIPAYSHCLMHSIVSPDFVKQDVKRLYADLLPFVKITLAEAGPALLGPFDKALQDYVQGLFKKRDIDVRLTTAVTSVEEFSPEGYRFPPAKRALLSDGNQLEFGTMIWSAGLAPRTFTQDLQDDVFVKHPRTKRLVVDEFLRVKGHEGSVWAIGDAAINESGAPLPQLAQVARQEGIFLAKVMNGEIREDAEPFRFFSLGSMAFIGELKGIYDGSSAGPLRDPSETRQTWMPPALKGLSAFFMWRFAYWGRQTSITNKILIPMYWFKTFIFGRDTSRY